MKSPLSQNSLPAGLGRKVLAGWLIASGLLPILNLANSTLVALLNIAAICAGILLLLNR